MELYEAIRTRRSCRRYTADEVSREALERIVAAATFAPSGKNRQNWRIFVARGEARDRIAELLGAQGLDLVAVVPVGKPAKAAPTPPRREGRVTWVGF